MNSLLYGLFLCALERTAEVMKRTEQVYDQQLIDQVADLRLRTHARAFFRGKRGLQHPRGPRVNLGVSLNISQPIIAEIVVLVDGVIQY